MRTVSMFLISLYLCGCQSGSENLSVEDGFKKFSNPLFSVDVPVGWEVDEIAKDNVTILHKEPKVSAVVMINLDLLPVELERARNEVTVKKWFEEGYKKSETNLVNESAIQFDGIKSGKGNSKIRHIYAKGPQKVTRLIFLVRDSTKWDQYSEIFDHMKESLNYK